MLIIHLYVCECEIIMLYSQILKRKLQMKTIANKHKNTYLEFQNLNWNARKADFFLKKLANRQKGFVVHLTFLSLWDERGMNWAVPQAGVGAQCLFDYLGSAGAMSQCSLLSVGDSIVSSAIKQ